MSDLRERMTPMPPSDQGGMQHPAPEDLTLFAMQLLPSAAASQMENHVRSCRTCRSELGRIFGDLTTVALTAEPATSPLAARERLLAQVAREKKIVTAASAKAASREEPKPEPAHAVASSRPLTEFGRGRASEPEIAPIVISGGRTAWHTWAGWAAAAALAVLSAGLYLSQRKVQENAATQRTEIERMNTLAQRSRQLMDSLTDPQAVRVVLAPKTPPRGPVAGVTYNPKKGTLILLASNLDPLQTYKTYELWVIPAAGGKSIPAGTFHPDEHGNASIILPNLPKNVKAKAFGVTIEDAGGSDRPTLPIIMAGS